MNTYRFHRLVYGIPFVSSTAMGRQFDQIPLAQLPSMRRIRSIITAEYAAIMVAFATNQAYNRRKVCGECRSTSMISKIGLISDGTPKPWHAVLPKFVTIRDG